MNNHLPIAHSLVINPDTWRQDHQALSLALAELTAMGHVNSHGRPFVASMTR
jgi:hypothetical protein